MTDKATPTVEEMVERLRDLLAKATPGDWKAVPSHQWDFFSIYPDTGKMEFPLATEPLLDGKQYLTTESIQANFALIVAMKNALPTLLAALSPTLDTGIAGDQPAQHRQQDVAEMREVVEAIDAVSRGGSNTVDLLIELGRIGKLARAALTAAQGSPNETDEFIGEVKVEVDSLHEDFEDDPRWQVIFRKREEMEKFLDAVRPLKAVTVTDIIERFSRTCDDAMEIINAALTQPRNPT